MRELDTGLHGWTVMQGDHSAHVLARSVPDGGVCEWKLIAGLPCWYVGLGGL